MGLRVLTFKLLGLGFTFWDIGSRSSVIGYRLLVPEVICHTSVALNDQTCGGGVPRPLTFEHLSPPLPLPPTTKQLLTLTHMPSTHETTNRMIPMALMWNISTSIGGTRSPPPPPGPGPGATTPFDTLRKYPGK